MDSIWIFSRFFPVIEENFTISATFQESRNMGIQEKWDKRMVWLWVVSRIQNWEEDQNSSRKPFFLQGNSF